MALTSNDLRDLSVDQLTAKLVELQNERVMLGFKAATESIENPMRFRTLRRDIARVQTILGQKRRGEG